MTASQLGEESVYFPYTTRSSLIHPQAMTEGLRHSRKLEAGADAEALEDAADWLVHMAYSACFL